jgi:outer membrane protein OmpA-like peptidoglycan-associated protein
MKRIFLLGLLVLAAFDGFCGGNDTFQVYFYRDDAHLTPQGRFRINKLITEKKLVHGQKLVVLGFTDYLGNQKHNDSLSSTRARNVCNYLVESGFDKSDITLCAGEGEIETKLVRKKDGNPPDRKVVIIVNRENKAVPALKKEMSELKVNETIALRNIFFEPGTPDILPSSNPELIRLLRFLQENKTVTIQIEGHICCKDPADGIDEPYEKGTLSEYRAKSIYDYLVAKGVDKSRLKYVGLGTSNPVVKPELTEEDRTKNRRVEIRVMSR